MAGKNYISKHDRFLYVRFEAKRVCKGCDKGDRCREPTHRKKVVELWICKICSKEHINRAGVIRHMQEEHERKPRNHTESAPRIPCQCGEEFLTMYQYYDHRRSAHGPRDKEGLKRRQTEESQKPDLKRAKKDVNPPAKFEDLLAKIKAQLQSKD